MLKHRNFWIANAVNFVFFSGYLILKFPLAYILSHDGFSLNKAYSLATTSAIGVALCSLILSVVLKKYPNQKHPFLLGLLVTVFSALLIQSTNHHVEILGLACYVVGNSLYFFNITLLFNKQFSDANERLHGNYIAHICLNLGALFGSFAFFFSLPSHSYILISVVLMGIALLLLACCYYSFKENQASTKENLYLYCGVFAMTGVVLFFLQNCSIIRWIVLIAFVITMASSIYRAKKYHMQGYFLFLMLILLISLPMWIANVVFYNQFFIFLHNRVSTILGFPSTVIVLLDPLVNVIFGWWWYGFTRKTVNPYNNLFYGLLLIFIAFGILGFGVYECPQGLKIMAFFPIVTIMLFACAQFLIQPTMHSCVTDLIGNKQDMVIALGALRAVRAVAAFFAFYLIKFSDLPDHAIISHPNADLYFGVALIALISLLIFSITRKWARKGTRDLSQRFPLYLNNLSNSFFRQR